MSATDPAAQSATAKLTIADVRAAATRIAGAIVDFRDEDDVPAAGGASERALYREAGKPFGPIYDLALHEAAALLGRPVDRSRVLCIGDGVVTDVLGANKQALDCLFIAQGIHGDAARGPEGVIDPARAADLLKAETTYARYAILDLAW